MVRSVVAVVILTLLLAFWWSAIHHFLHRSKFEGTVSLQREDRCPAVCRSRRSSAGASARGLTGVEGHRMRGNLVERVGLV